MLAASILGSRVLVWSRGKTWGAPRLLKPLEVRQDDLPAIVRNISEGSAKIRYAGLTFRTPDRPSPLDTVDINLSFENGTVGFDWVLLAPRNLEDVEKFKEFARVQGLEPNSCSMNGVSYLRVESGDVVKFTTSIITEMYDRPPDEPLALVHEGFEWP